MKFRRFTDAGRGGEFPASPSIYCKRMVKDMIQLLSTRKKMSLKAHERLLHIKDAIDDIIQYTEGSDFERYTNSSMTCRAVEHNFVIIAEAISALMNMQENSLLEEISQCKQFIGFRNRLVHRYYEVDNHIVWKAVWYDLPTLKAEVHALLDSQP